AALAAAAALLVIDVAGHASLRLGIEGLAVLACAGIVAWRRNLFLGLAAAVIIVAVTRALAS
ncbi:MAG TPA: hypothetical protein VFK38_03345, partial [Candidatus Limnocylindrales bacterium]|nr:hypothetical protein [Candidatus Limnocylindrales bacterium]